MVTGTTADRRSGGRGSAAGLRGFTLIEIAAALAVMGIALGLVVPAIQGGLKTRAVWREARQFASTLRHLRAEALVTGEIQQLAVDPERGSYETSAFDRAVHLSSDAVFISVDGGSMAGGEMVRVLFFPNGGTSGLEAIVGTREDPAGVRYRVTLDPLIGSVSIGDVRA